MIRSFTPNAPPRNQFSTPDPGNQLVEIDVELCAGSAPLSVNPLYWLVTDSGNVTYGAELGGQTLTTIELAAGNCTAGVVAFEMPDASTPAYGIVTAALPRGGRPVADRLTRPCTTATPSSSASSAPRRAWPRAHDRSDGDHHGADVPGSRRVRARVVLAR